MKSNIIQIANEHDLAVLEEQVRTRHRVDVLAIRALSILAYMPENINDLPEVPGGGVDEYDKDILEAAQRETMEESGWIISNINEIKLEDNCVFNPKVFSWINKIGFEQERQFYVSCKAEKFDPDHTYMTEGDSKKFQLVSLSLFVARTKYAVEVCENDHWVFQAKLRLKAIEKITGSM